VIIAGERRWRATKQAGLSTIDCYFNEDELTASDILEQQLIENCLREDLQPIEEAKAFAALIQLNGWTGKQLANVLHLPASRISRSLALLRLPGDIQDDVAPGKIPARSAYELSKLPDADSQRELAKKAASGRLTHQQTARIVRQRQGKRGKRAGTKLTFSAENGWKVVVSTSRTGTYHDVEQAILAALEEVRLRIANNVQLF
jgi:ParB family chromosome partitioning protein